MKKIRLFALLLIFIPVFVLAENSDVNLNVGNNSQIIEENLATKLDIAEPVILPGSILYWFKGSWQNLKLWFTFNPLAKAEKYLVIANTKLAELQQLSIKKVLSKEQLLSSLNGYNQDMQNLKQRIEAAKEKNDPNVDPLMDLITKQEFIRQRTMQKLEINTTDQEKIKAIEVVRQNSLDKLSELLSKINPEKIGERINKYITGEEPFDLDSFYNLQTLEELQNKLPPEAQAVIAQIRVKIIQQLGQSSGQQTAEEKINALQTALDNYRQSAGTSTEDLIQGVKSNISDLNSFKEDIKQKIKFLYGGGSTNTDCICESSYAPVCGKDGKNYSNACRAGCAKVEIAHKGVCDKESSDQNPGVDLNPGLVPAQ